MSGEGSGPDLLVYPSNEDIIPVDHYGHHIRIGSQVGYSLSLHLGIILQVKRGSFHYPVVHRFIVENEVLQDGSGFGAEALPKGARPRKGPLQNSYKVTIY